MKIKIWNVEKDKRKFGSDWEMFANYSHAPNGRIWVLWKTQQVDVKIVLAGSNWCIVKSVIKAQTLLAA